MAIEREGHSNVAVTSMCESESAFFCISPAPWRLCGPFFNVIARTDNGNPAVLFSQRYKPHLANWRKKKKMCQTARFSVIARDRRIVPPSQAGVGFGSGVGSHGLFCLMPIPREIKLRQKKGPTSWGMQKREPPLHCTRGRGGGSAQNKIWW